MTVVGELVIHPEGAKLEIPGDRSVSVSADPYEGRAAPGNVYLSYAGTVLTIRSLAEYTSHLYQGDKLRVLPTISYAVMNVPQPSLALIGQFKVVLLDMRTQSVREILTLFNRDEFYDRGFRRQHLVPLEDGFLLIYESGVARLQANGQVLWHVRVFWDDLFQGQDSEFVYYWSESEGDWGLKVADGSKVKPLHFTQSRPNGAKERNP